RLRRPDLVADAGVTDVVDIVAGAVRVRPVLPVAGDRAIHETRIHGGEPLVADAELRHDAGTETFHDDVRFFREPQKHLAPFRTFQVEPYRTLVAVDEPEKIRHERSPANAPHRAGIVPRLRDLDLDDVRPHVGEVPGRHRPGEQPRRSQDADAGQGFGTPGLHHLALSRPSSSAL